MNSLRLFEIPPPETENFLLGPGSNPSSESEFFCLIVFFLSQLSTEQLIHRWSNFIKWICTNNASETKTKQYPEKKNSRIIGFNLYLTHFVKQAAQRLNAIWNAGRDSCGILYASRRNIRYSYSPQIDYVKWTSPPPFQSLLKWKILIRIVMKWIPGRISENLGRRNEKWLRIRQESRTQSSDLDRTLTKKNQISETKTSKNLKESQRIAKNLGES